MELLFTEEEGPRLHEDEPAGIRGSGSYTLLFYYEITGNAIKQGLEDVMREHAQKTCYEQLQKLIIDEARKLQGGEES